MTTAETTTPPADATQSAPEGATPTDDTAPAENVGEKEIPADEGQPSGRSAKYRERAQAAETRAAELEQQITDYTATIERLQRLHVDQAITAAGVKPAAVHAVTDLADLLGDDGLPDSAKIAAAVKTARDRLGIQPPTFSRQTGMRSGAGAPQPKKDGFAAAFAPRE
ncbi:hypothetical protein AWC11_12045 [Mycobacterium interjectum]|nr:hypothetical protein AWC11_12045 [Mycobacterium interjectum]